MTYISICWRSHDLPPHRYTRTRARTRSGRQAHTRAVVVALTLTRAAPRCWRRDNDGLCTMSQFLTWARARPQWAKDQLTHCCSVGRTDPLYFTDPSSATAPFFSAYEQPFLRQVCLSVCVRVCGLGAFVWGGRPDGGARGTVLRSHLRPARKQRLPAMPHAGAHRCAGDSLAFVLHAAPHPLCFGKQTSLQPSPPRGLGLGLPPMGYAGMVL
jgi:hypothetical protein